MVTELATINSLGSLVAGILQLLNLALACIRNWAGLITVSFAGDSETLCSNHVSCPKFIL